MSLISSMSSIDNSLEGGGSASASGKKGVIQLSDGNFNLTSNKDLKSDPATGTITTTGLTTTGTIFAATVSTTSLIVDTLTESLTVVGDASITGNAIVDGTISTTGNAYFSSNVGVGTTDTAEYKFLVNDGTSNLFGVPVSSSGLSTGKAIVYDGNGWVYGNAGPANGTQIGEILAWDGTEWSANSAVVVEGTNVGIGSTQPTQKLDVAGNVKATDFIGSGDALSDLNASNVTSGTLSNSRLPGTISVSNLEATANLVVGGPADITGTLSVGGSLTGSSVTVTGDIQGLNLTSTGTLSAAGITSSDNVTITGADKSLTASNITTSNLIVSNRLSGGTISVSNLEATANLVVGGPADITGTLSASSIIGSGAGISTLNASNITSGTLNNARLPGTISVSNLEATANLVVGGPANITGSVSAGAIDGSSLTVTGDVQGLNLTSTGTLSAAGITSSDNVTITGADKSLTASNITTSNLTVSNFHSITGTLSASNVETSNLTVSNRLSGGTISVSNIEATANLVVGGPVDITGTLSAGGSLTGPSLTVSDQIQGATVSSTGHVIATGSVTGTTVNTPTLVVSKDAQITGNLTVSGGLVTITSTTTGTNQINITNNGTGPALIAKQTGAQPIVNFLDDSASALFISGGELTGKDGFVGLGTEAPQERLDVRGNIVSNGTISSTNVATSNLTVSNRLSGGTISVSNIEATANLVVGGPVDVTGTLSAAGITSSADVNVTGTISSSSTVTGTDVVVSGTAQGLNLTSTGTLSAAGITSSADTNITGALNLTLSDNGSAAGPEFTMHRYSANPAAADYIGQIKFTGEHSGVGADQVYAKITGKISDATQGSEDGLIEIAVVNAGSNKITTRFTNNALKLINTTGLEVDGTISATDNVTISGADKSITVSNISTSNLTVSNRLSGGTISVSNIEATANLVVGGPVDITGTLSAGAIDGSSLTVTGDVQGLNLTATGTLSAAGITSSDNVTITGADKSLTASNISTSNLTVSNFHSITGTLSASNVETSNLTVTNLNSVTNDAFVGGTLSASNVETSNLTVNGNTYISSNLGVGTADTAEYKFLVNDGTSNLFGVPYDKTALTTGKTIVYNGSGWVYDNAGPPDGTQTGEILSWDGSEWSANSAVVVEGSNVGIGSTQPREILDVTGNVRITQSVLINETFQGRAMRLNDTPASNLHYQPNFTITGSLTSAGDIKTNQAFRGHNMFLSNVLTISGGVVTNTGTVNTTINGSLTVQGDAVVNSNISAVTVNTGSLVATGDASIAGTLTASNIVGASPVTISSNLVMAPGYTLTAGAIQPPAGGGTLTTSNIVGSSFLTVTANTNVVAEFTASEKLIKYPRVKMTAATVSGFVASASSSISGWEPYEAFGLRDYSVGSGDSNVWASALSVGTEHKYIYNTGSYTGTVTTTATDASEYAGEWLQIELPTPIKLQYSQLFPRPDYPSVMPKNGTILGSTNSTDWYSISSWENASYATGEYTRHNALTENYYDYYRLVVEDIVGSGISALTVTEIADWELYGYPENDLGDGTSVLFKTVPNTPKTDFLDVYYDAKEYSGSGNITDESGNGVTGTIGSSVSYTSTEPKAWNFDGTVNGTVSASLTTPGGDWPHTLAVWFKADSITTTQSTNTIGWFGTLATRQSSVMKISPTFIGFDFVNDSQDATLNVQTGIWYHAVFVYPGGGVNNAKIYVNGFDAGATGGSTNAISLPTSTTLYLANQTNGSNPYFNGSIANYRLYDRSLSADEVWELYGNQKAYFSVSPDVVTYKAGRVGIGTSEPRAVLDVAGSLNLTNGITYNNIRSMFMAYSTNANYSTNWPIILEKTGYNIGNHYDTTTGWYTVPITGVYLFNIIVFATDGTGSTQYALKMKPGGQSVFTNDNWHASRNNASGDDSLLIYAVGGYPFTGSLDIYCEEGDMVGWGHRSTSVSLYYAHCAFSGRLITPI